MKQIAFVLFALLVLQNPLESQSYAFGVKGGPTIGIQQWNGFNGRDPLFRYHGVAFIESHREDNRFALFAQGGYHIKGSSLRTRPYFDPQFMRNIEARTSNMQFMNLSLELGAKQKFPFGGSKAYYGFGLRGEYTLDTEMDGYLAIYEGLENKFVFGVSLSGGLEIPMGRYISAIVEASVQPDFSKQIYIPPQDTGFTDTNGNIIILQEQDITNVAVEISVGFRFLHEITYVD